MLIDRKLLVLSAELARQWEQDNKRRELPEGAMRVAPGTDAVVWRIQPDYSGEL